MLFLREVKAQYGPNLFLCKHDIIFYAFGSYCKNLIIILKFKIRDRLLKCDRDPYETSKKPLLRIIKRLPQDPVFYIKNENEVFSYIFLGKVVSVCLYAYSMRKNVLGIL